jgi:hypothetical protein
MGDRKRDAKPHSTVPSLIVTPPASPPPTHSLSPALDARQTEAVAAGERSKLNRLAQQLGADDARVVASISGHDFPQQPPLHAKQDLNMAREQKR